MGESPNSPKRWETELKTKPSFATVRPKLVNRAKTAGRAIVVAQVVGHVLQDRSRELLNSHESSLRPIRLRQPRVVRGRSHEIHRVIKDREKVVAGAVGVANAAVAKCESA